MYRYSMMKTNMSSTREFPVKLLPPLPPFNVQCIVGVGIDSWVELRGDDCVPVDWHGQECDCRLAQAAENHLPRPCVAAPHPLRTRMPTTVTYHREKAYPETCDKYKYKLCRRDKNRHTHKILLSLSHTHTHTHAHAAHTHTHTHTPTNYDWQECPCSEQIALQHKRDEATRTL